MKLIPHILIGLLMAVIFLKQFEAYKAKPTLKQRSKFINFLIGYVVLVMLLLWSWN
ncbi:hypothetical protein ACFQZW_13035 [Lutibacter aestuarii]|uniref:Uncharacterized protein n=1 Tax=Lutibacter aestuarii TaxID=861111 RepID=A0ABW2ZAI0_9FLAO